MPALTSFIAWVAETVAQLLVWTGVYWLVLDGRAPRNAFDVKIAVLATGLFMVGSGYIFTTDTAAVLFRPRYARFYPIVAAVLYMLHAQVWTAGWKAPAS